MKIKILLLGLAGLVGCAPQATVRQFDVSYEEADKRLRELYPSTVGRLKDAEHGVLVKRDETSRDDQFEIHIREPAKEGVSRTQIVVRALAQGSDVSVQSHLGTRTSLLPPRDAQLESQKMEQIAATLLKK